MTRERWLLTLVATLVTDTTWLYLLLAFLGFTAEIHGAPLPWPVVFGLPMLAAFTHLLLRNRDHAESKLGPIGSILGVAVIYWAVSVGRIGDATYAGFSWPLHLVAGSLDARAMYATVILLLAAAYLWTRGVRRANEAEPGSGLSRSFRTGLVVFVGIIFFEETGDLDLGTRAMMLPFFAASLMGLAASHSAGRLGTGAGWLGFAAASVAAILATGLIVAILGSIVIRQSADILSTGWIAMMTAFVAEVREFIQGLQLEGSAGGDGGERGGGAGAILVEPPGAAGPEWSTVETIVIILEPVMIIAGAAAFVWLCHKLLAAPDRVWPDLAVDLSSEERERLGDEDALGISQLLHRVLPGWARRSGTGSPGRIPAPRTGIEKACALYHRLLEAAGKRGARFTASQTPFERAPHLLAALAGAPVEEITRRFVAACYGREPSAVEAIESLSVRLEAAVRAADARRP